MLPVSSGTLFTLPRPSFLIRSLGTYIFHRFPALVLRLLAFFPRPYRHTPLGVNFKSISEEESRSFLNYQEM